MKTLIYTAALGLLCMFIEMLNLRKFVWPAAVVGLFAILGLNMATWGTNQGFYHNMLMTDNFSVAFSVCCF
jgi:NADH-quinone oxidoreductase subunit N